MRSLASLDMCNFPHLVLKMPGCPLRLDRHAENAVHTSLVAVHFCSLSPKHDAKLDHDETHVSAILYTFRAFGERPGKHSLNCNELRSLSVTRKYLAMRWSPIYLKLVRWRIGSNWGTSEQNASAVQQHATGVSKQGGTGYR